MLFAVENQITKPINLGSGTGVTIKQLAETIANYFNKSINWLTDKPSGDAKRIFSMERANSYGFYPEISIEKGVKETIEWFIKNKDLTDKRFNILNIEKDLVLLALFNDELNGTSNKILL